MRRLVLGFALFVAYLVTARLGLSIGPVGGFATLVWPPTGIALAALLLYGEGLWPAVTLGALAVNVINGAPLHIAAAIAAGNSLEAIVAVRLLRRSGFEPDLGRVSDVLRLVFLGALLPPLLGATIGASALWAGGLNSLGQLPSTWRAWWTGDGLGALLVAPVLLVWISPRRGWPVAPRWLEAVAVGAATTLCSLFLFGGLAPGMGQGPLGQPYFLFPVLIWASLRLGQRGGVSVVALSSTIAVAGTALGKGVFAREQLSESLLLVQSFAGVSAATTLLLGAAVTEARRAIRARDEFLSIASHELRTPLTVLDLVVAIVARMSEGNPQLLAKVDSLKRQLRRLTGLVGNLLDVSKVMEGRLAVELEEVDLDGVVREVVSRFKDEAARGQTPLAVQSEQCVGRWDRLRLDQVVTNLLSNALKYGGGKRIEVEVFSGESEGTLRVKDLGIGIAPDAQKRIFERFERAVPDRNFGGLGLGLWIVNRIVTALDGTVEVRSELGRGAEFWVRLPKHPALPPARRAPRADEGASDVSRTPHEL